MEPVHSTDDVHGHGGDGGSSGGGGATLGTVVGACFVVNLVTFAGCCCWKAYAANSAVATCTIIATNLNVSYLGPASSLTTTRRASPSRKATTHPTRTARTSWMDPRPGSPRSPWPSCPRTPPRKRNRDLCGGGLQ